MKLILLTPPDFFVEEDKILTALFEEGLDLLHLRKPDTEPVYSERLLTLLPESHHNQIVVHDHFYLKEELALLFHPIISAELSFKDFVIGNYFKVSNVNDLISLSNMCKSSFYCKFKEVFGMTAKQWLLKQRNTHILNKVMTSETTVGELMEEFRFESQAHFTHYCKQHFNCTPRELIMKYQVVNQ